MKFSIKDFFSKYDQIRNENFIFLCGGGFEKLPSAHMYASKYASALLWWRSLSYRNQTIDLGSILEILSKLNILEKLLS